MDEVATASGFVYLDEACPGIVQSLRYSTNENFIGGVVAGYGGQRAIMTKEAAAALVQVQSRVAEDGFCLLIYDTYRPQKAVDHFASWSENPSDVSRQQEYYPRVDKAKVFELGYVAKRSGHSRGSTVDLTLVAVNDRNNILCPPVKTIRKFRVDNNEEVELPFLDDQSVDMGTSFDLMDSFSHYACPFLSSEQQANRMYLRERMLEAGFRPYDEEWWHFTLNVEPYPDSYFNFDVPLI